MKTIISLSILLLALTANAQQSVTIPNNAVPVSGEVRSNTGDIVVRSGITASIRSNTGDIYIESGATVTEIRSNTGNIYYESGATIGDVDSNSGDFILSTFTNGSSPEPTPDFITAAPGEVVDEWTYWGPWPWIYVNGSGWAFLVADDAGLYVYPTYDGPVILLLN